MNNRKIAAASLTELLASAQQVVTALHEWRKNPDQHALIDRVIPEAEHVVNGLTEVMTPVSGVQHILEHFH